MNFLKQLFETPREKNLRRLGEFDENVFSPRYKIDSGGEFGDFNSQGLTEEELNLLIGKELHFLLRLSEEWETPRNIEGKISYNPSFEEKSYNILLPRSQTSVPCGPIYPAGTRPEFKRKKISLDISALNIDLDDDFTFREFIKSSEWNRLCKNEAGLYVFNYAEY